jgi:hypothetical protein
MWKDSEGNHRPLAYVLLGVLALAAVGMVFALVGTPGWGIPFELPSVGFSK